jgi:hypothetical protein
LSHRQRRQMMNKSLILTPHRKIRLEGLCLAGGFAKPVPARPTATASDSANKRFEAQGTPPA